MSEREGGGIDRQRKKGRERRKEGERTRGRIEEGIRRKSIQTMQYLQL